MAMSAHLKVMQQLMDHLQRDDAEAFLGLLTDDIEYHWHVGAKPVQGKEKMRKFLKNYSAGYIQKIWRVAHYAEAGTLLLIEGHEELYEKTYDRVIQNPFMQACEFRDGKLCKMRDYYEPTNLRPPQIDSVTATIT
jgi:limonene-1,2-epoxide hydrolase